LDLLDLDHYLVHACIEGPEAGVYYRGKVYMNEKTLIELPEYVSCISHRFTVHVTAESDDFVQLRVTPVRQNQFEIYSTGPCIANWMVMGTRKDIELEVEPIITNVNAMGPYQWL